MPMVAGISPRWMRLSNTMGTRQRLFSSTVTKRPPSWNTITAAGVPAVYWAGTYTQ
jgi:hypothetical protein